MDEGRRSADNDDHTSSRCMELHPGSVECDRDACRSGKSRNNREERPAARSAMDPCPRDHNSILVCSCRGKWRGIGFRVSRQVKNRPSAENARRGVTAKRKWRQRETQAMNKQDDTLNDHQSAKPRYGGVKPLRPNHQNQIPAANQSEGPRSHPQPIIEHSVVNNRLSAQTLQSLGCCRPTEEHTDHRDAPRKRGEAKEQSQKTKMHERFDESVLRQGEPQNSSGIYTTKFSSSPVVNACTGRNGPPATRSEPIASRKSIVAPPNSSSVTFGKRRNHLQNGGW